MTPLLPKKYETIMGIEVTFVPTALGFYYKGYTYNVPKLSSDEHQAIHTRLLEINEELGYYPRD